MFSSDCRVRIVPLHDPASLSLREAGIHCAGIDYLKGTFLAGTDHSPTHLVWLILKGRVRFHSGKKAEFVRAGELIFSPAGNPHWIESRASDPATVAAWFHLNRGPLWAEVEGKPPGVFAACQGDALGRVLDLHLVEGERNDPFALSLGSRYAEAVLLTLQRELAQITSNASPAVLLSQRKIQAVSEAIARDLAAPWNVGSLARRAGVSPGHLHRLCLLHWGVAPMHHVRRLRIAKAMSLLLRTSLKIEAIAEAVGYASSYALSDAFLRQTGLRPGAFRNASAMSY